jgi:hypothetical protein
LYFLFINDPSGSLTRGVRNCIPGTVSFHLAYLETAFPLIAFISEKRDPDYAKGKAPPLYADAD